MLHYGTSKLLSIRVYDKEKELCDKLTKHYNLRGRGRLLAKLMQEEVMRIKANKKKS